MNPKIDYALLGRALDFYKGEGFEYVEAPWLVTEYAIRATLPEHFDALQIGTSVGGNAIGTGGLLQPYYDGENFLVGSAEQSLISMRLSPGRYCAITPCFRIEERQDLFTRDVFMKLELYDNRERADVRGLVEAALGFYSRYAVGPVERTTCEVEDGIDLDLAGIEIGSFGRRTSEDFDPWVFGTGLALPRFSVAAALARGGVL